MKSIWMLLVSALFWSWLSAIVSGFNPLSLSLRRYSTVRSSSSELRDLPKKSNFEYALLFDCDGVILETEELHRRAYNAAFQEFGLNIDGEPVQWSVEYYDMLQNTVGGGKPKMFFHFRQTMNGRFPSSRLLGPPPSTPVDQQTLIDALQTYKNRQYQIFLETEAVPRPGVLRLMDQALADPSIAVGVCSASTKESAIKTLELTLGPERVEQLDVCILGDDVSAKKPDPLIYRVALQKLSSPTKDDKLITITPDQCIVIEDSLIGLQAAKGAGMKCIITYTSGTAHVNFYQHGADAQIPNLSQVDLSDLFGPTGPRPDLLAHIREEPPLVAAAP